MGNSQGHLSQMLKRRHYNDTAYDAVSQVPVVTIDREETLLPKTPYTYIITFPNNVEGCKDKLEAHFRKIEEHRKQVASTASNNPSTGEPKSNELDNRFRVVMVPVEDLTDLTKKPFKEIKEGLSQVVPPSIKDNYITLMKTPLTDSGTPLIRFIGFQTEKPFKKSNNLFVAENFEENDIRSGKPIYQSRIQQLD